jgi:cytochrome c-type biogenesis protein CcmH
VRRAAALLIATLSLVAALATPALSPAATRANPRASFTQIQSEVMCVACHESLAVARSPEAYSENNYIRELIAQGETRQQIEHNLVEQYGPSVLAKPPAHGFNVLVYVVPPVLVIIGLVTLAVTIPKWRRRARQADAEPQARPAELSDDDARRLDADLAKQR